ncbi:O-methyltransferase [Xylariomycetidae sp. FL2044]|nr:O-methyltransferase [Xylariomycetidae sp. FL2044]
MSSSLDAIFSSLRAIDAGSARSEDDRLLLLAEIHRTLRRVHDTTTAAVGTLIEAGVFTDWADAERLLLQLAADQLITETDEDTWAPTPWSLRLGRESTFAPLYRRFNHEVATPVFMTLPSHLKEVGFQNPIDPAQGNFQSVHGPGSTFFGYIASDPTINQHFADAMNCHSASNSDPPLGRSLRHRTPDHPGRSARPHPRRPCLGGSIGHDSERLLKKHPDVPAESLIFPLLPGPPGLPHDFCKPQPVRGARIYYCHIVLHDWADEQAAEILERVRDAMEPGYSRILAHEVLVAAQGVSSTVTTTDMTMMALFSTRERSKSEWRGPVNRLEEIERI